MKNRKILTILLITVMTAGVFSGCSLLLDLLEVPLSITERIAAFQIAINSENRSTTLILDNFGPEDEMQQYDNAKAESYWDTAFPATVEYTFLILDKEDTGAVSVAVTKKSADTGDLLGVYNYTFVMYQKPANENWLIREIYDEADNMLIKKIEL